MSVASRNGGVSLPIAGPLPPTFDVVKNDGSISSKSRSSSIRCISTEPTIPRQPTNPIRMIDLFAKLLPQCRHDRVTHRTRADDGLAGHRDVPGAQALRQRRAHGTLDPLGDVRARKRV